MNPKSVAKHYPTIASAANKNTFDYLIIIDFEATCDNGEHPTISLSRNNQEMLEFPFVVVKLLDPPQPESQQQYTQVIHKEQHFVKPEYTSKLTPFCTGLTGITDDVIEKLGKPLREVIKHFDTFIEQMKDKNFCILTDGEWDLKQLLIRESKNKNIHLKSHYYTFFDMKKEYKKCFPNVHKCSLKQMVEHSGISFVGRHHSGIDDCMTLVELVNVLLHHGHKFQDPCVIDPYYDPFRDASFCNFHQPQYYYSPYAYMPHPMYHNYTVQYPQIAPKRPTRSQRTVKKKGHKTARVNMIQMSETQK